MKESNITVSSDYIQNRIFTIRSTQIMIDRDLAEMYQVKTKVLNQAVKRNGERFPEAFRFQLTDAEKNELVTNCDRFQSLKHASVNPYAFTEQGVAMLSAVLHSDVAVKVSIQIIQAFVEMRKFITAYATIFQQLDNIALKQLKLDAVKFNKQYPTLQIKQFDKTHDRFLIIDNTDVYHFGASLKDLGEKWFAFSKLDTASVTILQSIKELI